MGDFLNEVVIFLEEYYVYVIGAGLILILMLVGLLTSKGKEKKKTKPEQPMANINEVNTGSINDVANTLQSDFMQPIDIVDLPEANAINPMVPEQGPVVPAVAPVEPKVGMPAAPEVVPVVPETGMPATPTVAPVEPEAGMPAIPEVAPVEPEVGMPATPEVAPVEPEKGLQDASTFNAVNSSIVVEPAVEEVKSVEEITPINTDKLDKTEVMDFSAPQPQQPAEINPELNQAFKVDQSQYSNDNILNGENSATDVPKV